VAAAIAKSARYFDGWLQSEMLSRASLRKCRNCQTSE
jgi:hypothetical protein